MENGKPGKPKVDWDEAKDLLYFLAPAWFMAGAGFGGCLLCIFSFIVTIAAALRLGIWIIQW